jgi:transposase-like protein
MKKTTIISGRHCPKCKSEENQASFGYNKSGTQRCRCKICNITYTLNPKTKAYDEEIRNRAIKTYYSGVSGRGVGKIFGMSKANVYNSC